jgi:hypothetical protein
MIFFIKHFFLQLFFHISSPFIYPFAYLFRWKIRTKNILVDKYLYGWRNRFKWIWYYLNDSEYLDGTFTEYGDDEKYYPKLIWKLGNFFRSWWFNSIRNACVNYNNYTAKIVIGKFVYVYKSYGNNKNFIEFRRFENKTLPAIQFYLFNKRFFIGYARSSRMWIELFK